MKMTQTQQQNVPTLRFPGFSGEWEQFYFDNLFEISAGGDIENHNVSDHRSDKFCYPIYANAKKNKGFYGYSSIYRVDQDVITVAGRGNIGIAHARKEKFFPIVRLLVLRLKKDASVEFFEQSINQIKIFIESTGVPQLTAPQLSKYKIFSTEIAEQKKIASFLSSVDIRIAQLGQKKVLLQQYKKGCMQKLFSGVLRFKDAQGNDFPDWEEKRLGDISTSFSGGTPSSSNKEYYSGKIPFIGSGNIGAKSVDQYITESALKNSSAKMVEKGDLLYALYGATSGEVAISKINGAINQAILCIRSDEVSLYIYQYLLFKKGRILATYLQGGQGNLSAQIIKALAIKLPCRVEQQKIAGFLSAIDRKIDLVATELDHAKTFKKGLLQQMFI